MPFEPSAYLTNTVGKMRCHDVAKSDQASETFTGLLASSENDIRKYLEDGDRNPFDLLVKVTDALRPMMGAAHFGGVIAAMLGQPDAGVDSRGMAKTVALIAVTATAVLKDLAFVDYRLMVKHDCERCVMSGDCEKAGGERGGSDVDQQGEPPPAGEAGGEG